MQPRINKFLLILLLFVFSNFSNAQSVCTNWQQVFFDDFEYNTQIPGLDPSKVYHTTPMNLSSYGLSANHTPGGSRGMYMNIQNGVSGLIYRRPFVGLCVGENYRFSFWAKEVDVANSDNLNFVIRDQAGAIIKDTNNVILSKNWQNFFLNFTATDTQVYFEIFSNIPGSGGGNDICFDDFKLEVCTPDPTSYTLTVCGANQVVNLINSVTNPILPNGGTWTGPSTLTNGDKGTFTSGTNASGTYTYSVTPATYCATQKAQVVVSASSINKPTVVVSPASCSAPGTATISNYNASYVYTFSPAIGTPVVASNGVISGLNFNQNYTVIASSGTCASVASDTFKINAQILTPTVSVLGDTICLGKNGTLTTTTSPQGGTFTWSNGAGNVSSIQASPTTTTTYNVTYTLNGCSANANAKIVVNQPTIPLFDTILPICKDVLAPTLPLTSNNAISGTWNPAAINSTSAGTTTYTFTPTLGQCATNQTKVITVNPLPNVTAGADQVICSGISTTISASGAATYSWDNNLGNGASQTISPLITTTYTVVGTDANGCKNTDDVQIIVTNDLQVTFTADTTKSCTPAVVNFTNTTVGGNKYLWDFGDGKTSTDMNPNHIFNTPGVYTVSLTVINTNGGCTVTTTKNNYINVYLNPIAEFTASTYTITSLYNEVYFNNNSKNASSYLWSFGDNSNSVSTEQNTSHTYDPTVLQNYVVTLIAKNEYGCVDTTKTIIKMTEDVVVFVPNAFTPDGDEFNNTFIPIIASGIDSYQYELFIYNRWGEVVFESHDAHVGWDGTFQGQICQDGSYTWLINLKKASVDSRVSKFGSVTLLR